MEKSIKIKLAAMIVAVAGACSMAQAGTVYHTDGTGALGTAGSWSGGAAPTTSDIAYFGTNAVARSIATGVANPSYLGMVFNNTNAGKWTINNNNGSTYRRIGLGSSGITVAGSADVDILCGAYLLADQNWDIASGRTLTFGSHSVTYGPAGLTNSAFLLTKTGAGTLVMANTNYNTGGITVSGGTLQSTVVGSLGSGAVTIKDSGTLLADVGGALGSGTVTMQGGGTLASINAITHSNNISIGAGGANINGNMVLSGSLSGSGSMTHGSYTGGGAMNLTLNGDSSGFSGVVTNNKKITLGHNNALGSGKLVMNDAATLVGFNGMNLANDIILHGVTTNGGGAVGVAMTFAGAISGDGAFVKNGSSDVTLSGTNTYTGGTKVLAGKFLITGDSSGAAGDMLIYSNAVLGGTGIIGANLKFAEGARLAFDAALTVSAGKQVTFDAFNITDIVGLTSSISNGIYTLIGGTVSFANVANVGLANAYSLGDGKQAYFQEGSLKLVVIPEPATVGMIGIGALVALLVRRMKVY
jgi:fibronectin-binding autotransporter adhesin